MNFWYGLALIAVAALATESAAEHSYLVQVYDKDDFKCAGILVDSSIVLVEKDCVYFTYPSDIVVVVGATSTSEGTKYSGTSYSPRTNFGLVVLETPVIEEIEFAQICKASAADEAEIKIVGLEVSEEKNAKPTNEVKITEGAVYTKDCNAKSLSFNNKPFKTEACYSSAQGSCKGTYGAPLFVNNELCGIVSKSASCNSEAKGIFDDLGELEEAVKSTQEDLAYENEIRQQIGLAPLG